MAGQLPKIARARMAPSSHWFFPSLFYCKIAGAFKCVLLRFSLVGIKQNERLFDHWFMDISLKQSSIRLLFLSKAPSMNSSLFPVFTASMYSEGIDGTSRPEEM